ncbi:hypothetical protein BAE44_0019318, partial [Dichanthelium oligosanthes]
LSCVSNIVKEMKDAMMMLPEVVVGKIGRECNRVAHELAQLARRTMHCGVWIDNAPSCISELIVILSLINEGTLFWQKNLSCATNT